MTLVVDASVVVAALVDTGSVGLWAEDRLADDALAAPHLMPAEAANVLRRAEHRREISADTAAVAYADLGEISVELFSFEPFAERVWQLRANVTPYDAWYVALAETLDTHFATLDHRLAAAAGPTCTFETPPR
ncbi:MAG: type II toxin-antitoxin system VapC family toxin [Acidimicrobiia bacterium]